MYYFIEITCLPDEDISTGFVMGKVMDVLHLCFVNMEKQFGSNPIGISFPEYVDEPPRIGAKIRLFSRDSSHLKSLDLHSHLSRFEDYIHVRAIREIDRPTMSHAIFKRVQVKSSRERLIRRQINRTRQPEEVVRQQYQTFEEELVSLPYVNMRSHSTDNRFRLFIEKQPVSHSIEGSFNSYGLSNVATVPDF